MLVVLLATSAVTAAPVTVTFQINDSYVKDKVIPNAGIGVTAVEDGPIVAGRVPSDAPGPKPLAEFPRGTERR